MGRGLFATHLHGLHLVIAEFVESGALGWRLTASAGWSTRDEAAGADATLHIVLVTGEGADLIQAAEGGGSADTGLWLDATNVATHETKFAEFVFVVLIGGDPTAQRLCVQGKAAGVAKANDILFSLDTNDPVLAIHGNVGAAAGLD